MAVKLDLATVLRAMTAAGAHAPAFIALVGEVKKLFSEKDQRVLESALADLQLQNDTGHARLQDKLAAAEAEGGE